MNEQTDADPSADKSEPEVYDLVIRRAHVFDGHEALAGLRDVGVRGSEIAAVSEGALKDKREVLAGEGWVMPGLIDTHLHFYDFMAVTNPETLQEFVEKEVPARLDLSSSTG